MKDSVASRSSCGASPTTPSAEEKVFGSREIRLMSAWRVIAR